MTDRKPWVSHYYEVRIPVEEKPKHKWHLLPETLTEWAMWWLFTPVGFWLLENGLEAH